MEVILSQTHIVQFSNDYSTGVPTILTNLVHKHKTMKFDQVGERPKSTSKSADRLKGLEKLHYLIQITAYKKSIVFYPYTYPFLSFKNRESLPASV